MQAWLVLALFLVADQHDPATVVATTAPTEIDTNATSH
jgi:hypothetical protein